MQASMGYAAYYASLLQVEMQDALVKVRVVCSRALLCMMCVITCYVWVCDTGVRDLLVRAAAQGQQHRSLDLPAQSSRAAVRAG
jgi:hypothetical protein